MAEIINFPAKVTTTEYFGGCPVCGRSSCYFNIGADHWFVCHDHRTKWCVGSNLFSGWRDEDEQTWLANEYRFASYRNVEPIRCEGDGAA